MSNGYKAFEEQARQMRDRFVAAATEEADKWLEYTLAMIQRMSGASAGQDVSSGNGNQPLVNVTREPPARGGTTLADVTREVIGSIDGTEFDSVGLRGLIEPVWGPMNGPTQRANLANLLRRMVERSELELVEQGVGSRPSRFRKKGVKSMDTHNEHG